MTSKDDFFKDLHEDEQTELEESIIYLTEFFREPGINSDDSDPDIDLKLKEMIKTRSEYEQLLE